MSEFNFKTDFKPITANEIYDQSQNYKREIDTSEANIVAIIPRGEVIRNFVYSGALDCISEQANLSLISVSPGESMLEMLRNNYGEVFPLENVEEKWIVRIQREILETAHNRWLWSRAAQERSKLRDSEAVTFRQKLIRTAKKIISYPIANRFGLRTLSKTERASSRLFQTNDEYSKLIKKIRPSLVFNGSHIHSAVATQAVQSAQWLGIPTATFIFSWDNLTSQGRIMLPYDYFLVWNEKIKTQLLEMYEWIRPEQVFVTGTPQFDFHFQPKFYQSREEFCAQIGADSSRPIVLYTTGMANHMPGEPEIVEGIADILRESGGENSPQLLVRVYAKDLTGRFEDLKLRRPDILFPHVAWEKSWLTPKYEDSYALINALRHSALGINVASTISLELCMFDKPVINVGYNPPSVSENELKYADYYEFDHYRPVVESGAVEVARSVTEMRDLIQKSLNEPQRQMAERRRLISKMFGDTLDGSSGKRVAQVLLNITEQIRSKK